MQMGFVNVYMKKNPSSLVFVIQVQSSMDARWILLLSRYWVLW